MTLPGFTLQPGQSIFEQVVFAAIRAFVSGAYRPGQPFPSVRALAADLKINPNTAAKVIQHLIQERWLEVRPGVGTFVAEPPEARAADRARLLQRTVEALVVDAKRLGLGRAELIAAIEAAWARLGRDKEGEGGQP
jgi:GntR family transcriptional regulator